MGVVKKFKTNRQSGFTLVETMVALMILSLVLLALLPLFPQSSAWANFTAKNVELSHLVSRVASDIKQDPSRIGTEWVDVGNTKTVDVNVTNLPAYPYPVTLELQKETSPNLVRVKITATHEDGKNPVTGYVYVKGGN